MYLPYRHVSFMELFSLGMWHDKTGRLLHLWFALSIKFALTDSAESEGTSCREREVSFSFSREEYREYTVLNKRADLSSSLSYQDPMFQRKTNNSTLMTIQLIISSTIFLSCAALARGRWPHYCETQTNLRIAFRFIRSRSRAERRVRAEEKRGVIYRSFRGIGAFGIKSVRPFTRPSGCYSVSRLCRYPMRLSPPFPHNPSRRRLIPLPRQKDYQTYRYELMRLNR